MFEKLTEWRDPHTRVFKHMANGRPVDMNMIRDHIAAYEDTGLTPDEIDELKDENDRLCAALKLAQARARDYEADIEAGRLVRMESCDECRYKLESHAWEYYTYPCRECRQRTKSHFARPEAARAAMGREDTHD